MHSGCRGFKIDLAFKVQIFVFYFSFLFFDLLFLFLSFYYF